MIIWLLGLSGSGKTYLGEMLYTKIKSDFINTVFIDGDEFRSLMLNDLGYTETDRERNGKRLLNFCHWLKNQKINVVASFLSNYPKHQSYNQEILGRAYYQIYIKADIDILKRKSNRNVYCKSKNVIGLDIPFNTPVSSNKIFLNDYQECTARNFIDKVYAEIKDRIS